MKKKLSLLLELKRELKKLSWIGSRKEWYVICNKLIEIEQCTIQSYCSTKTYTTYQKLHLKKHKKKMR